MVNIKLMKEDGLTDRVGINHHGLKSEPNHSE